MNAVTNRSISESALREVADQLKSEDGENPEYDRALAELIAYSVGDGEEELLRLYPNQYKPKTRGYAVSLGRTVTEYITVMVNAKNAEQAKQLALDTAGDHNFRDGTEGEPEYAVNDVKEIAN